ncbi:DNA-binding Lrp family transcriptional regulator [Streptomyces sp. SAI-135]|uniref:Lrp/AsnC family transcriptional regulator n=1 Tax=unclassified Streptomyces TaxID=2593676 RepID=UPI002474234A|nr:MULTISPECIES: Lrp/AsnC family transcriptional regulator [unclassified Streptomyces]MDH6522537.1 DNA-binding Lrp family transcriptional regulator [Streptomyces sp. SAI-090]MDH6554158.1 DNA-binding Lrp family transcriptional regulator [Streptomyces sp. SAI-041]MDH6573422.1 DNA-binding Lrp family transcriptional regulator [Streptomyces sp. SAI-117]MDH6581824.1 DNA-binding Lrp family transcriptional regulator [Streptomyces sp. SAI-133]MDH6613845.1 DNA-binding Lrp family transcriptional regulato
MQHSALLDELDQRIVHALQIDPRASWTRIGTVLGIDPVTAARRWERLRGDGVAWTCAYTSAAARQQELAIVEIDGAGQPLLIAEQLLDDPQCITIDITSGGRDLLLTVIAPDLHSLTNYLLERLGGLAHVRGIRTHLVSEIIGEGSNWRLNVLTDAEQARLRPITRTTIEVTRPFTSHESAVLSALVSDARAATTSIADQTGLSPRRVRDLVRELLQTGRVTLRAEVQAAAIGRPIYAWFFLRVPAATAATISPRLNSLRDIRGTFRIAGPNNVIIALWLRDLTEVGRLEAAIESHLPDVEVVDRSVVLRCAKRIGVIFDQEGRLLHRA